MLMITTPCDDEGCGGTVEFDLPPEGRSGRRLLGQCDGCGAHFTLWGGERRRLRSADVAGATAGSPVGIPHG